MPGGECWGVAPAVPVVPHSASGSCFSGFLRFLSPHSWMEAAYQACRAGLQGIERLAAIECLPLASARMCPMTML